MWSHTIAILIGGKSRRMGSPKHRVELSNGKTMLDTMLEFAAAISTSTIIVGGDVEGLESIHDLRHQQGPVGGIEALLASGIDEQYLVVGCDMPNLQPEHVDELLQCGGNAVITCDDEIQTLPILLCSSALRTCTTYLDTGKRSIKGFINVLPHTKVHMHISNRRHFNSINSPEEVSKIIESP